MRVPREKKKGLRRGLGNRHHAAIKPEDDVGEAERRKRRLRVWEMRTGSKMTFEAISEALGFGYETVREDFQWCLDQFRPPNVEEVRSEEEANLQRLAMEIRLGRQTVLARLNLASALDKDGKLLVSHGETLDLLDRLVRLDREATRISESRRRLLGANAPVVVHVDGQVGHDHQHQHRGAVGTYSLADVLRVAAKNAGEELPAGLLPPKSEDDDEKERLQ